VNRRTLVGTLCGVAGATTAGCLGVLGGGSEPPPDPVDLSGGKADDRGGMEIGRHGGPNGQIFYGSNAPDHGNPAWFHTLTYGLFPYYFEHREMGWTAEAVYVTDYSVVEFDAPAEGAFSLPAPTAPETFGDGEEMTYVVESEARGGMGPAIVPFSEGGDAASFVDAHGGEALSFDAITPEFVGTYGQ
jgi:nitrous oxide reductase accessory protein NosL